MPAAARPGLKRWATNFCDKCCGPAPSQPPAQSFRHGAPPPGRATATRKVGETALSHPLHLNPPGPFGWGSCAKRSRKMHALRAYPMLTHQLYTIH